VQIAPAKGSEPAFDRREDGVRIASYYAWLFPNLMLNVYPWGLSANLVLPQGLTRTRVLFRSYVRDPALLDRGAGAGLDAVEHEDEAIVEGCGAACALGSTPRALLPHARARRSPLPPAALRVPRSQVAQRRQCAPPASAAATLRRGDAIHSSGMSRMKITAPA
jgi:hypothetical protein